MKLFNKISNEFKGCSWKSNVNDTIMGLINVIKHQYMQGINCSCILHDCLANLNSSSTTLTALITYFLKQLRGNVFNIL